VRPTATHSSSGASCTSRSAQGQTSPKPWERMARYMAQPPSVHWQAAKGVLRYLAGTADYGITFGGTSTGLEAYTDADFAETSTPPVHHWLRLHPQRRRHRAGLSRSRQTVAASTTEAEYMAAASATKEGSVASEAVERSWSSRQRHHRHQRRQPRAQSSYSRTQCSPCAPSTSTWSTTLPRERVARGEVSFKLHPDRQHGGGRPDQGRYRPTSSPPAGAAWG
jgi:hypothetical protein